MAISYRGVNNAAGQAAGTTTTASTVSISATLPSSTAAGDRVFVIQCSSNSAAGTIPPGWTLVGSKNTAIASSLGAASAAAGQRYMTVVYRDYDGVWSMPAFTLASAAQNSHWIGAVSVTPTSGSVFDAPTVSSVADDAGAAGTGHSATTGSSFTTTSGGFLIIGQVNNDNVTATTESLTQTGATFASLTERADGGTATGNDVSGKVYTASVTTGASATVTVANTLSAASQGGNLIIQQTERVWAGPKFAGVGDLLAGASSATVNIDSPSSVVADDIILAVIVTNQNPFPSPTVTVVPTGFTAVPAGTVGSSSYASTYVFWKRATGGGEPATYNFTLSAAPFRIAYAARYTGCVTSGNPIDVDTSGVVTSPPTDTPFPNVSTTTTGNDELLVWIGGTWNGRELVPPTGFEIDCQGVNDNSSAGIYLLSKTQAAAGATGTLSSSHIIASDSKSVWLGALLPSAAGFTGSGSLSGTATITGAGVLGYTGGSSALTVTATRTGAGQGEGSGSRSTTATITGTGVVATSVGSTALTSTATIAGAGSVGLLQSSTALTATAATAGDGVVGFGGTGSLSATATIAGAGGGAGSGSLTATATGTGAGVVAITGSGSSTSTATIAGGGAVGTVTGGSRSVTATITGAGVVGKVDYGSRTATATITGSGVLAIEGTGSPLTIIADIQGSAVGESFGTGIQTTTAAITGSGFVGLVGSGSNTTTATIAGAGSGRGSGSRSVTATITGSGVVARFGSGSLTVTATFTAAAGSGGAGSGSCDVAATVTGSGVVGVVGSGSITVLAVITSQPSASGSGALVVSATIVGEGENPDLLPAGPPPPDRIVIPRIANRAVIPVISNRASRPVVDDRAVVAQT